VTFVGQQTVNDADDRLIAVDQNHLGKLVGVTLVFAEKSTVDWQSPPVLSTASHQ